MYLELFSLRASCASTGKGFTKGTADICGLRLGHFFGLSPPLKT